MDTQKKILIVDDSPLVCEMFKNLLAKKGYEITSVSDGTSALKLLGRERFSVVLLDLIMPGMGGIDVLKSYRKVNQEICIIVVTAYGSEETAIEAIREGADDFIVKEYDTDGLDSIITRGLEKRRLVLENIALTKQLKELNTALQSAYSRTRDEKDYFCNLLSNVEYAIVLSKSDGCILGYNDIFVKITGLPEKNLFGVCLFDLVESGSRGDAASLFKKVRAGITRTIRTKFVTKEQRAVDINLSAISFKMDKERLILSTVVASRQEGGNFIAK